MSVCDEGWGGENTEYIYEDACRLAMFYARDLETRAIEKAQGCLIGMWHAFEERNPNKEPPYACPHATALRAVAEDPTLVLYAIGTCGNCGHTNPHEIPSNTKTCIPHCRRHNNKHRCLDWKAKESQ